MNNNKQKAKQRMIGRKVSILACVQAMVTAIVMLQGLPALAEKGEPKAETKVENNAEKKESTPMDFFKGEPDTAYPDTSPLLTNVTGRDYQSLNGEWNIVIDEAGMAWRVITKHDYFSSGAGVAEFQHRLLEASFDDSDTLAVPGDWNSQRLDLDRYRSRILYQKDVSLEPKEDKRYFIHFGAANYTTDVFVNDELVGRHIGGYTSFNFDITPYVKSGNNIIIARVDAHLDETTIPTMRTSDFWKYGGIIGDVGLVTVDNTFIENYHIYLADRESNTIQGWVQLAGDNIANQSIELGIKKLGVEGVGHQRYGNLS